MYKLLPNKESRPTSNGGFTLLEVVVAVSILTVGLLAIAKLQGAAIRGNNYAGNSAIASTVASDRAEKLLALEMGSPLLQDTDGDGGAGLADTGTDADHASTVGVNGTSFQVYGNIAPDSPNTGNKTINLIVMWNDRGRTRHLELTQVR